MPTTLSIKAIEEATYIITAAFTDEDGNAETPKAGLVWTLTDGNGNIVNDREDVALIEATSIDIVLSGDDLAVLAGETQTRILLIEGTYDSALGSDLPIRDEATFEITNLTGVT